MTAAILFCALLLDAAFGEPSWLWRKLPHPAEIMGRLVNWADRRFNTGAERRRKGTVVFCLLAAASLAAGALIASLPFGWVAELFIVAILLAQRSLSDHVNAVADALRMSLPEGRIAVTRIVGRDVAQMDEPAVTRAAIESASESLSDGVIAPAFWYLVAGLPGILLYKLTNTADSMIGHRNERYEEFGWAAARFDDLLNWVPARLTAFLAALLHRRIADWPAIVQDARSHRSPNAGWPEAAVARVLGVALAGPRSYDGAMRDFPFVNFEGRLSAGPDDIEAAVKVLWRVWGALLALVALIAVAW